MALAVVLAAVPIMAIAGTVRGSLAAVGPTPIGIGKCQCPSDTGGDQARQHQTGRGGDAQPRTHVVTTLSRTAQQLRLMNLILAQSGSPNLLAEAITWARSGEPQQSKSTGRYCGSAAVLR
jgi:hypothetical protein